MVVVRLSTSTSTQIVVINLIEISGTFTTSGLLMGVASKVKLVVAAMANF
jgi:hypothetical protein